MAGIWTLREVQKIKCEKNINKSFHTKNKKKLQQNHENKYQRKVTLSHAASMAAWLSG